MKILAHRHIPITIIGGGIHGCAIALRLLRDMPTAAPHIAIVDRHPAPLTQWRNKTERQGMTTLRSPAVHHISTDPLGIVEYAERQNRTNELVPPYSQPSTKLFWDYCNDTLSVIREHPMFYQLNVAELRWDKGAGKYPFRLISTDNIGFRSSCVVLAIGADDCAYIPSAWTAWVRQYPDRILHASQFSVDCELRCVAGKKSVIVGGGLTAGTLAKSLSEHGHQVVLIARKQLKTEQFDFPPIWLGPKALTEFSREPDFLRRYQIIQKHRGEGSITPEIMDALKNDTNIDIYPETCVHNIYKTDSENLHVETSHGLISDVFRVILATGYRFDLRRYGFMRALLKQYPIELVCGLPKLDAELQFYPIENLFGTGTVGQLQVGPASGNIAGAHLAYERFREKLLSLLP